MYDAYFHFNKYDSNENRIYLTELYHKRGEHQPHHDSKNELLTENFLVQPKFNSFNSNEIIYSEAQTVSHICNLICLPSMVIIRAPNSTPFVFK